MPTPPHTHAQPALGGRGREMLCRRHSPAVRSPFFFDLTCVLLVLLFVCFCVFVCVCLSRCVSASASVCPCVSVCLSLCVSLFVCLHLHLCVSEHKRKADVMYLSIYLSIYLYIYIYIYIPQRKAHDVAGARDLIHVSSASCLTCILLLMSWAGARSLPPLSLSISTIHTRTHTHTHTHTQRKVGVDSSPIDNLYR